MIKKILGFFLWWWKRVDCTNGFCDFVLAPSLEDSEYEYRVCEICRKKEKSPKDMSILFWMRCDKNDKADMHDMLYMKVAAGVCGGIHPKYLNKYHTELNEVLKNTVKLLEGEIY